MTNEKKIFLGILVAIAITALIFAIKAIVSIFKAPNANQPKQENKNPITDPNVDNRIGKTAYANSDGVIVLNSDFSIYKFAKKDEWVGKVYKIGENNYIVFGDRIVLQGDVDLV